MTTVGKISRIIDRELPNADKEVLLVLDGTTGQNGLMQAKQFSEIAGVTGMALTKLDGTAKGGIVIAVADALLGEVSPKMAKALGQSSAVKILIPLNKCDVLAPGVSDKSTSELLSDAVRMIRDIM